MDYFKATLSGLTAPFLAVCFPVWSVFMGAKATGMAAVTAGFAEMAASPLFWLLVIFLFALFFFASRLGSKTLRVILFWIPTVAISTLGVGTVALVAFIFFHFSRVNRP